MVPTPAATPITTPYPVPMTTIPEGLQDHNPPGVASVKVSNAPAHT